MSQWLLDTTPRFESEERYIAERARYLERRVGIERKYGRALAHAELGYSHSGIAGGLDVSEGTAKKYLERLQAEFGARVIESRPQANPVEVIE